MAMVTAPEGVHTDPLFDTPTTFEPVTEAHKDGTPRLIKDRRGNYAAAWWTGNIWAYVQTVEQVDFKPSHCAIKEAV